MRGHNGLLLQRSMSGLLLARGVEEDIGAQAGEGVDIYGGGSSLVGILPSLPGHELSVRTGEKTLEV